MQRTCLLALALGCCLPLPGCITRVLQIRSDPPGARVYLNGEELGVTPLNRTFTDYGSHKLVVAKDYYEPAAETVAIDAPWWCYFPVDFFVELWPAEVVDRHEFSFQLTEAMSPEADVDQLLSNLDALRQKLGPK
jgi:hypothetical protein